ncbi:MAG: hypothetical protein RAP70_00260 [Candidatus Celaenobacter antarcticus]|nr:hypothetical protein [Candidatus Celaenobacter antarcticus]MDP8313493.1 hypothetical protein [Candidatus Celaenobacter antarcticus]
MKKSTKIILIVIVIVAAALIIINNFVRKDTDVLLAKVNDNEIYHSELESTAAMYGLQFTQKDAVLILDQLINNEVAQIYAEKTGMINEPGFNKDFEWQKNEIRKELLINTMLEDITKNKVTISDDELQEYLDENPFVKIRTIFIPVKDDTIKIEKEIYQAYEKLENGADFEHLQKKYTDKAYRTPNNKAELIKLEVLQNILPYDSTIPAIGEFTQPVLTKYGYYIIKRYDDPTLEEIREETGTTIQNEKEKSYLNEYLESFKEDIIINYANLETGLASQTDANDELVVATKGDMKLLFGMLKKYLDFFLTTEQRENLAYIDYKDITIQIALQEFLYRTSLNENYESSMNFISQWEAQSQEFDTNWDDYVVQQVYSKVISPAMQVSENEIQDYYDAHKGEFIVDNVQQPLSDVHYDISLDLTNNRYMDWFTNVINEYNIIIEKYEENL